MGKYLLDLYKICLTNALNEYKYFDAAVQRIQR